MEFSRIKTLCKERGITIPQLAEKVGISNPGLYRSISNESMTVDTLEKISAALNVPISYFFPKDINMTEEAKSAVKNLQDEIKLHEVVAKQMQGKLYLYRELIKNIKTKYTIIIKNLGKMDKSAKDAANDIDFYLATAEIIDQYLGTNEPPDPNLFDTMKTKFGVDIIP